MPKFQEAAQAVVDGDIATLQSLFERQPELIAARSPQHGATLLHYVGANGPVEESMQKTPENAVDVAETLLRHGAAVDAVIEEDPASTPLVALITSQFPAEAGVQGELTTLLVEAGAAVNGLADDGYPLACALLFEYPDAVSALIRCGARVDNIVAAAAMGRMEFVVSCFDEEQNLTAAGASYPEPFKRTFDDKQIIQIALEHAQKYKHDEIADYLSIIVNKI